MGLLTTSPTPTLVADRKMNLAAIPELYNFILGGGVVGYATEESDSDWDSAAIVATAIFAIGGNSGGKGKEKEDNDVRSYDGSRVWEDSMKEESQDMGE